MFGWKRVASSNGLCVPIEELSAGVVVRQLDSGAEAWAPFPHCCWCPEPGTSGVRLGCHSHTQRCVHGYVCEASDFFLYFLLAGKISTSTSTSFSQPPSPRSQLMSSSIVLRMADFSIFQVSVGTQTQWRSVETAVAQFLGHCLHLYKL